MLSVDPGYERFEIHALSIRRTGVVLSAHIIFIEATTPQIVTPDDAGYQTDINNVFFSLDMVESSCHTDIFAGGFIVRAIKNR